MTRASGVGLSVALYCTTVADSDVQSLDYFFLLSFHLSDLR